MGLSLNNIYQRPYVKQDERRLVKKREEDASTNSAQKENQSGENSKSKGLQYVEQKTPTYTPAYEQKFSIPAQNAYHNVNIHTNPQPAPTRQAPAQNINIDEQKTNVDNKINIAQILKDFKNTALAIGTPDDLNEIVDSYLSAVEKQVKKEAADGKLVKNTLKNAAAVLDRHISETLNKDSKVVENWVDTLFLQKINLRYNDNEINERFLVKFPEGSTQQPKQQEKITQSQQIEQTAQQVTQEEQIVTPTVAAQTKSVKIPQDKQLKSLFIQAKKYAYANNPEQAIKSFEQALNRAIEIDDTETSGKIYYEVGKIYDDHDFLAQALKSYNQSLKLSTDENVKTKAHYSMAQIYDDINQVTPAMDHYFSTVSHAGEAENLPAQTASLTKLGNIYSAMYEKEAFDYYDLATDLAEETDNSNLKGFVASSQGGAHIKFDEPEKALKAYSKAAQNYTLAESPTKTAQTYLAAADIMVEFNNLGKAHNLLTKAQKFALQTENTELTKEINTKLRQLQMYS